MSNLIDRMPDSGSMLRTILDYYRKVGYRGATANEVADAIHVLYQRVSPAVSRLKIDGFIEPKDKAKRLSACGSPMSVYVLGVSFSMELRSAGYSIHTRCQCKGRYGCGQLSDEHGQHSMLGSGELWLCELEATELVTTTTGSKFEMCLECAANFPSNLVEASCSIGDKTK